MEKQKNQGHRNDFQSREAWSLKSGVSSGNNIEACYVMKKVGCNPPGSTGVDAAENSCVTVCLYLLHGYVPCNFSIIVVC